MEEILGESMNSNKPNLKSPLKVNKQGSLSSRDNKNRKVSFSDKYDVPPIP